MSRLKKHKPSAKAAANSEAKRKPGTLKGVLAARPSAFKPLSRDELRQWYK